MAIIAAIAVTLIGHNLLVAASFPLGQVTLHGVEAFAGSVAFSPNELDYLVLHPIHEDQS